MNFLDHASYHGLIIRHLIADDRWHRCPTTDHPKKKNGAYIFDGEKGAVQNWATMQDIALFRPERTERVSRNTWRAHVRNSFAAEAVRHELARRNAEALIKECVRKTHPYTKAKGFPLVRGLVHPGGDLIIPMREFSNYYGVVNTAQRIAPDGS
jgi:putative DNA primase/helicase